MGVSGSRPRNSRAHSLQAEHTSHPLDAGLGRGLAVTAEGYSVVPATHPPFTWRGMSMGMVLSHRRDWRESLHHGCLLSTVGPARGASEGKYKCSSNLLSFCVFVTQHYCSNS